MNKVNNYKHFCKKKYTAFPWPTLFIKYILEPWKPRLCFLNKNILWWWPCLTLIGQLVAAGWAGGHQGWEVRKCWKLLSVLGQRNIYMIYEHNIWMKAISAAILESATWVFIVVMDSSNQVLFASGSWFCWCLIPLGQTFKNTRLPKREFELCWGGQFPSSTPAWFVFTIFTCCCL